VHLGTILTHDSSLEAFGVKVYMIIGPTTTGIDFCIRMTYRRI